MVNYHLKKTPKTRFLNLFRRLFTIPFFENILVSKVLNSKSVFFQKLVPPDYLYKKNSLRSVTREGIKYKLDISNVVDHYVYYGFKDANYDSILPDLKNAQVILDIGANVGVTSMFFASINSKARIISFEPHPDTFKKAIENLKLNTFRNIEIINTGLGEKRDNLKLYEVNEHNPGMNRLLAIEKDLPFKIVEINTLDDILMARNISKVDVIKLDVEGFEYAVLKGAKEIINSKPVLFIELDDDNLKENNKSAKELIELLVLFGYKEFYRADDLSPITVQSNFDHCHFDIVAKSEKK